MKKFFLIAAFALATVSSFAGNPVTNSIGLSALVFATTPLGGTERVPIYQFGMKSATVDQITANASGAALANNLATSNALAAVRANANTVSNSFSSVSNSFVVVSNNFITASNALVFANAATSNALAAANLSTSNQVAGLLQRTNTFYGANNPSNYQSGAQVSTTVNGALAAAGVVTNSGTASFANLATPTLNLGSLTTPSTALDQTNVLIDLSVAQFQTITIVPRTGTSAFCFIYTNAVDGVNVWLLASANNGIAWYFAAGGNPDSWNAARQTNSFNVGSAAGAGAMLNWQVIGGRVVFTSSIRP